MTALQFIRTSVLRPLRVIKRIAIKGAVQFQNTLEIGAEAEDLFSLSNVTRAMYKLNSVNRSTIIMEKIKKVNTIGNSL